MYKRSMTHRPGATVWCRRRCACRFGCLAQPVDAAARRPAAPRRAATGALRAHTSGRVAARAAGHGDPLGRRCSRRRVPPPRVAPPGAARAPSGASCHRRARSSKAAAVLQLWVGRACSGVPPSAPSRRVRCTRSARATITVTHAPCRGHSGRRHARAAACM